MKFPGTGQLSAAKAGWLMVILFFGWLAFLLVPAPKPKPEPTPIVRPPLRLVTLGLPDNPDLERLPEFFALYADQAEWQDGKTIFAYWNSYTNSHSYFFVATRTGSAYHFTPMGDPEVDDGNNRGNSDAVEEAWKDTVPEASKIRLFNFGVRIATYIDGWGRAVPIPPLEIKVLKPPRIVPDLNLKKVIVQPSDLKIQPIDFEQKH